MYNNWSTNQFSENVQPNPPVNQQLYNQQNQSQGYSSQQQQYPGVAYSMQQQQPNGWDYPSNQPQLIPFTQENQHATAPLYSLAAQTAWSTAEGGPYNNPSPLQMTQQNYGNYGQTQLNINAPSFVPRSSGYQQNQSQHDNYGPSYASAPMYGMDGYVEPGYYNNHVQSCAPSMEQYYGESARQDDYSYDQMYSVGANCQQYIPSQELQEKILTSNQNALLTEIQVGLEQLIADPEEFESWAGAIKERISDPTMSEESKVIAVQITAEMAVACQNVIPELCGSPQYLFARLLACLSKENVSLLKMSILPTLQKFHDERLHMDEDAKRSLLLFLAEVYTNIELANGSHIKKLGTAVVDELDELIKGSITDLIMRTTILVLKLAGRHMDSVLDTRARVDDIFTKLSGYAKGHPQLTENIKSQIVALIELREKNWGYSKCGTPGGIIGADGQPLPLSDEERDFLESHFGALERNEGAPTASEEAEMMKDFEKYLKEEQDAKNCENAKMMEKLKINEEDETAEE